MLNPPFICKTGKVSSKASKSADGTVVFAAPVTGKTILHMADIEDTGPVVREILINPEQYVGQDICICGDAISLDDIPKIFTKVTGVPAISKTLKEDELRSQFKAMSKFVQDELLDMFNWFQEYGYYGKDKDWTTGKKLTTLNTFEDWLKKTGWKGE